MRKILVSAVLALVLVTSAAVPAFAADYADVTVTATPLYLSITNTNDDTNNLWTINNLGTGSESGKGVILTNTTYYANPIDDDHDTTAPNNTSVIDTECYFIVTNVAGASPCDLVITWGTFSGGGANMTNSDAGTNTGTTYGAWAYYSGMADYSTTGKVLVKASASDTLYTAGLAADTSLKWGVAILTQQDGWSSGDPSTSTLTITAIAD